LFQQAQRQLEAPAIVAHRLQLQYREQRRRCE
jgi:hypothetical protein